GTVGAGAALGLRQLQRRGYVEGTGAHWRLTALGASVASREAHNQALWDAYRQFGYALDLPLVHEEPTRDIHEVLPPRVVESLEQQLMKGSGAR
ncbi:MAG: hypothetical protein HC915_15120, partial [Anaerolineae bacterium]|nr:hypothetical protein [Anaerolineae bacterium]